MLNSQKTPAQAQITCHVCKSRAHTSSCTFSISCLPSCQAVCPPNTNRTDPCRASWQPPRGAGPPPPPPLLLHVHVCSSVSYSHTSLKYLHQQHVLGCLHNSRQHDNGCNRYTPAKQQKCMRHNALQQEGAEWQCHEPGEDMGTTYNTVWTQLAEQYLASPVPSSWKPPKRISLFLKTTILWPERAMGPPLDESCSHLKLSRSSLHRSR